MFLLRVTDAQGASAVDTASVIVHPDPMLRHLVELTLAADVSRWTLSESESLQQRLLLLLGDDVQLRVRDIRVEPKSGEVVLVFYVEQRSSGPLSADTSRPLEASAATAALAAPAAVWQPMAGREVERRLAQRFWREPNILGTAVTDVRSTVCQNDCSGHGTCETESRACACDAFWMPDLFWFWGWTEANCNWSILYVVIGVVVLFLGCTTCCWCLMRLCKREGGGAVKKTLRKRVKLQKYSPLGTQDDEIPTRELIAKCPYVHCLYASLLLILQ